jgi:hypothetical protein
MTQLPIFLDLDGVINNSFTNDICWLNSDPTTPINHCNHRVLTKFFELVKPKIILISAWGLRSDEENQLFLNELHFKDYILDNINTYTNRTSRNRVEQIVNWMDAHPEEKDFIIIDDEFEEQYNAHPKLVGHVYKVDPRVGFYHKDLLSCMQLYYRNSDLTITKRSINSLEKYLIEMKCPRIPLIVQFIDTLTKNIGSSILNMKSASFWYFNSNALQKNLLHNVLIKYHQLVLSGE